MNDIRSDNNGFRSNATSGYLDFLLVPQLKFKAMWNFRKRWLEAIAYLDSRALLPLKVQSAAELAQAVNNPSRALCLIHRSKVAQHLGAGRVPRGPPTCNQKVGFSKEQAGAKRCPFAAGSRISN